MPPKAISFIKVNFFNLRYLYRSSFLLFLSLNIGDKKILSTP